METSEKKEPAIRTWIIIFLATATVIAQGFFSFVVVGDRGQPDWDYRPVKDVPGESPYAIYQKLPHPQHVSGDREK
jgi:hypothetical protein